MINTSPVLPASLPKGAPASEQQVFPQECWGLGLLFEVWVMPTNYHVTALGMQCFRDLAGASGRMGHTKEILK